MGTKKSLSSTGGALASRIASRCATAVLLAALCAGASAAEQPGQLSPGAGAPTYGAWDKKCQHSSLFTYVMDYLGDAAKQHKRPAPKSDGRLCQIAEAFIGSTPGEIPRPQVLAFISNWAGLPGSVKTPIVAEFDESDERTIAERIVQSAAGTAALNAVNPLVGMTTKRIGRSRTRVSIVVSDIPVDISPPLPRRLELGQQAKLAGKLVGGATNPKVFVVDPSGKLTTPEQPPGDAFSATLACGDRPGTIQVEIRADYEGSSALAANFPVACGESPPTSIALAGEPWPTDPDAAAKKMFDLLNADRTKAGVKPLTWDPAIAGVARSISDALAKNGPSGAGDVGERLRKEGISSPLVLESAAAERTFERANDRILASPRDRATLLNAEATNAGIGVVQATDPEGRPLVYVVDVLIKELPPVDVAKVREQLREEVARKRKDARINAITPDPTLDDVAEKFAQALAAAGGTLSKEKANELTAPLNKSFRSVTMISGAKQDPMDFAEEPQSTAPGKSLGVGVAQGRHPVLGRNAVYVVLMVGTPRGGAAEETAAAPKKKKAKAATK